MHRKSLILLMIIIFSNTVFAHPIKVCNDTKITNSIYEGIKVTKDCKLTFKNMDDIVIGDMYNNVCAGIEVMPGKKLTISLEGCGNVNIYGGCYKSLGNMYSCAGIYVPQGATLEIIGNGVLNVFGCMGASGIGGQGVGIYCSDTDYSKTNAGSIYIRGGNITATSYSSNFASCSGTGAGIGGGGIYNLIDREELIGGSVELIDISGGDVVAIGGNGEDSNGTGAGIGGGGVCNLGNKVDFINGGDLKKINISGGNITARGGSNNNTEGMGAGIGGGGIYNVGKCRRMIAGELLNISDRYFDEARNFKENINVGSGNVYSGGTCVMGVSPIVVSNNINTSIKESVKKSKKKIISTLIMSIIGVLVMVGK